MKHVPMISLAAVLLAALATPAPAAESYDGCTGIIESLPATITKSGTWCLNHELSTANASGAAITVSAHHAIIDCEGYALRGTANAATTTAIGIKSTDQLNITVRGCRINGFHTGISLLGSGHAVLDNQLASIRSVGIAIDSSPGLVRGNHITDVGTTGGRPANRGIYATGDVDVLDNTIDRIRGNHATSRTVGILSRLGQSNVIAGNRVTRMENLLAGGTYAIQVGVGNAASRTVVRDNQLAALANNAVGIGLSCTATKNLTRGNQINGWATAVSANCLVQNNVANN